MPLNTAISSGPEFHYPVTLMTRAALFAAVHRHTGSVIPVKAPSHQDERIGLLCTFPEHCLSVSAGDVTLRQRD